MKDRHLMYEAPMQDGAYLSQEQNVAYRMYTQDSIAEANTDTAASMFFQKGLQRLSVDKSSLVPFDFLMCLMGKPALNNFSESQ